MRRHRLHARIAFVLCSVAIAGCSEGSLLDSADNPGASLIVSPAEPQTVVGGRLKLTAIGLDEQGAPMGTIPVRWESRDTSIATVSPNGEVVGRRAGQTVVVAISPTDRREVELVVAAGTLGSLEVSPDSVALAVGATVQLSAVARDANGAELPGSVAAWTSSDPDVAAVSETGLVTGLSTGSAELVAAIAGSSAKASVVVTEADVASVVVTPAQAGLTTGETVQLEAVAADADGAVLPGRAVAWSSSSPSTAAVSATGLVTAGAAGTATITATIEGRTASAELSVTAAPLPVAQVTVSPSAFSIVAGSTQQLTARALSADGTPLSRPVTWTSSATQTATVSATGLVAGRQAGSATLTAMVEGKSATAAATVTEAAAEVADVVVAPATASLVVGGTRALAASVRDADGNVLSGRPVSWSSSNPAAATVSATGTVRGVAPGAATISAASGGHTGTAAVTVTVAPVAVITVAPASAGLQVGETLSLSAIARDANGGILTGRSVSWTSSNLNLATVSSAGLVRAVAAGTVAITATSEGKSGTSTITVAPVPVASVSVTPASVELTAGATRAMSVVLRGADGSELSGRTVTWSSSRSSAASVSPAGLVTAVAEGTATITATSEGKSGGALVTVTASGGGDGGGGGTGGGETHAGYYVSPTGSSGGDGSVARPWDLASALGRSLRGGDTLWLRGGTYRGAFTSTLSGTSTAPVVVRQYPGERATIDGQLVVRGSYSTFWGFELMSSVTAPGNVAGLGVFGPGTRIINLVIHDHGGNGIGTWAEGPNTEIYGNLVYNNGRQRVVPNFAHGIYGQNSTGSKWVRENIVFNQFGYGLHFYAEGGALQGIQLEGNVVFQNGTPATSRGEPNLELGGANPASGARVVGNLIYKSSGEGTNAWVGYNEGTQNQDLVLRDNYIVGGSPALRLRKWSQVTASGNTFVGTAELVNVLGSRSGFSWASNRHYRTPTATAWTVDNAGYTFANWVNRAGIGSSDAASSSPSGTQVFVRPNKYERGRANVTVFNWSGAGSASANLSGILAVGQRYEVRNAQNFFGTPAASGTYGGGSITIPLTAVAPPRPVGGSIATLTSTGTTFHSFVVLPSP